MLALEWYDEWGRRASDAGLVLERVPLGDGEPVFVLLEPCDGGHVWHGLDGRWKVITTVKEDVPREVSGREVSRL